MSCFTIYQDNYTDSTLVSNYFIDEYMKEANDAQLKVYLYLIRTMSAHKSTSISDMADTFNHTEKDILRALKYWEQHKLLTLEFDNSKNLVGIHLRDLKNMTEGCRKYSADIVPLTPLIKQAETVENPYEKPVYSLDQLKEFKNSEETAQLLFVAEQYIGRPLSANEIKTVIFFSDKLKFSNDLIDYLIQYCVDRGKKDFRYIEKVAVSWAEAGVTTPKQAARNSSKYDKNVYQVMKALGKLNAPTASEASYIEKWIKEYGFSQDIIFEACERTVLSTENHRFEYADSILSSWKRLDVHIKADINALDEAYRQKHPAKAKASDGSNNKFNEFKQNNYDFETLEKEILSN